MPRLQRLEPAALLAVADDEKMEGGAVVRRAIRPEPLERPEQGFHVFLRRQPPDVEQHGRGSARRKAERGARGVRLRGIGRGLKHFGVHAEIDGLHVFHAPVVQDGRQRRAGHKGARAAVVNVTHVAAGDFHHDLGGRLPEIFHGRAHVRLGEMGMVKPDDRDAERAAAGERFPSELVRVVGLDDVRPLGFEDALDGAQVQQHAVLRGAGNERRTDRVNARALAFLDGGSLAGHDEDVAVVVWRVGAQVGNLFREIAFHSAADR